MVESKAGHLNLHGQTTQIRHPHPLLGRLHRLRRLRQTQRRFLQRLKLERLSGEQGFRLYNDVGVS